MRLLDRYLLRELLIPFGYCLGGFLIFWISFDLVAELANFQAQELPAADIALYYVLKTPEFFAVVLPVALLLALLYALSNHARHHELTAMRASGISLWRLAVPYLGLGFGLSLVLFVVNEAWAPQAAEAAEEIRDQSGIPRGNGQRLEFRLGFRNARQNRSWYAAAFNPRTGEMLQPQVTWVLPDGSVREIYADKAVWEEGRWVFGSVRTNVQVLLYPPGAGQIPAQFETNRLVLTTDVETPEAIKSEIKVQQMETLRAARRTQLSIREIQDYMRLHPDEIAKRFMLETKLHGRLSNPWTCLVVVLIALPFGAAPGRRNVFVGVASSILICFSFFVLGQLGLALGTRGLVPPWLAAWAPNLIFGLSGAWLTWRIR